MTFTYLELKTALLDYTENSETSFVANLPVFIKIAEDRILKGARLNFFRKNATDTLTDSSPYLTVPADFLAPLELSITVSGSEVFLVQKDPSFVKMYASDKGADAQPKYYAQYDVLTMVLGPTPDSAYATDLAYFYRPTSLTAGADGGSTWLSNNAPEAMLYGALVECYIYMKGEEDVLAVYIGKFAEAVGKLKNFGEAQETSDEYRAGTVRRERI